MLRTLRRFFGAPEAVDIMFANIRSIDERLDKLEGILSRVVQKMPTKTVASSANVRLDTHHRNIVALGDAVNHLYEELERCGVGVEPPAPPPIEER